MPRVSDSVGRLAVPIRTPRWIAAADLLTIVTLALTASVYAFGGFREEFFGVRVSLTSWSRLFAFACVIAVVRHAIWPRDPLHVRVAGAVRTGLATGGVRPALAASASTRVSVLVAGYFAAAIIGFAPGKTAIRTSHDLLENLPARWDAQWYRRVARDGYQWDGNSRRQQNVAFFPAFPMLMYPLGLALGRQWLLAGLLINVAAFTGALVYLFRLARDQLAATEDEAHTAVWLLAAYPFAAYFSAPYTEGLYLLGAVAAFYHLERGEAWKAAGWGLLAGLCRPNGFLLSGMLAILVAWRAWKEKRARVSWPVAAAIVAPVLGLSLFCAYLWMQFGDPLAWMRGQAAWGRVFVGVWPAARALVMDRWTAIARDGLLAYFVQHPVDSMNTCAAIFALASTVPVTRRFGPAYGAVIVLNLLPPLLMGGMLSIGRMTAVLFPIFLYLGVFVRPASRPAWIAGFCTVQGLIAAMFFTWRPVF